MESIWILSSSCFLESEDDATYSNVAYLNTLMPLITCSHVSHVTGFESSSSSSKYPRIPSLTISAFNYYQ